jgi:hypothetical protein
MWFPTLVCPGYTILFFVLTEIQPSVVFIVEIKGLKYVIRLNIANNPTITQEKGKMDRVVRLDIAPGKTRILRGVYYKGNVKMNLIVIWKKGMKEAMWIATNIDPKKALEIYLDRMKIEESFKDLKSLLACWGWRES